MPLEKGDNPRAIAHNIRTEENAGKSRNQAVAIALHTAKDDEMSVKEKSEDADPVPLYQQVGQKGMTIADIQRRNRDLWEPDKQGNDRGDGTTSDKKEQNK